MPRTVAWSLPRLVKMDRFLIPKKKARTQEEQCHIPATNPPAEEVEGEPNLIQMQAATDSEEEVDERLPEQDEQDTDPPPEETGEQRERCTSAAALDSGTDGCIRAAVDISKLPAGEI